MREDDSTVYVDSSTSQRGNVEIDWTTNQKSWLCSRVDTTVRRKQTLSNTLIGLRRDVLPSLISRPLLLVPSSSMPVLATPLQCRSAKRHIYTVRCRVHTSIGHVYAYILFVRLCVIVLADDLSLLLWRLVYRLAISNSSAK